MPDFDFQWRNIPSKKIKYNNDRINEFLSITKLPKEFFKNKLCLDAGCGNGRWTYAMLKLGAKVESFDISEEAIKKCLFVNESAYIKDILDLKENPIYDFVLSWGVLHHIKEPKLAFSKVASQVKKGGILHIMVYHRDTQKIYEEGRKIWNNLNEKEKIDYCNKMIKKYKGDFHGWWDALNPTYNWSYFPDEIVKWFEDEEFKDIIITEEYNINIQGTKK